MLLRRRDAELSTAWQSQDFSQIDRPECGLVLISGPTNWHLYTRIYFADEPANTDDPILAQVPDDRCSTLIAERQSPGVYLFVVRLQGEGETVFFEV